MYVFPGPGTLRQNDAHKARDSKNGRLLGARSGPHICSDSPPLRCARCSLVPSFNTMKQAEYVLVVRMSLGSQGFAQTISRTCCRV